MIEFQDRRLQPLGHPSVYIVPRTWPFSRRISSATLVPLHNRPFSDRLMLSTSAAARKVPVQCQSRNGNERRRYVISEPYHLVAEIEPAAREMRRPRLDFQDNG